jgi:hypothetical protein
VGFLVPGGASSGARAIVRLRIAILVSGRGFGYQSSTSLVPPRITCPKQFNFWDRIYRSPTHVSASSRDDVGHLILSVNGPTKFHPWGPNQTVCPRIGNTSLSSTPPRKRAPIPAHTTSASGLKGVRAPSRTWEICWSELLMMLPPLARKRARR